MRILVSAFNTLVSRARSLWRGARRRDDLLHEIDAEFQHHIASHAERLQRDQGVPPAEALRLARLEFGSTQRYKEEARDARGLRSIDAILMSPLDFKLGVRMLMRSPALSLVGGLGMAVSIAVSVGFFAFIQAHIYPVLPLAEGERIIAIENRDTKLDNENRQALHDYTTWRREMRTVTDIGAFRTVGRNLVTTDGTPEPIAVAEMSASGFTLARVAPLMGRYLAESDELPGAPPVAVIGYETWKHRFASDPNVVGKSLRLNAATHTIVGVMPAKFAFPQNHEFWIPFKANPSAFRRMKGPAIYVFGRLAPGISMQAANAEIAVLGKRAAADFPATNRTIMPMVMPYTHSLTDIQGITFWQTAQIELMVSILLVVVALNVAVLVYARTATRQGEIAVRTALGASRLRIVRQLFVEGLVLSALSSLVGLGMAQVGLKLGNGIVETELGAAFWTSYAMRPETLLFTIGVTIVAATITGVLPALQATGRGLQQNLRGVSGGTSGIRLGRTWTTLIVAQVAIASAALPTAVNMGWAQVRNYVTKPNYDPSRILVTMLRVEPGTTVDTTSAEALQRAAAIDAERFGNRVRELITRIGAEPGVTAVTYGVELARHRGRIDADDGKIRELPGGDWAIASEGITPASMPLLGTRILSGRGIAAADMDTASTAVVVNQAFARRAFGSASAVGRRIRYAEVKAQGEDAAIPPSRWYTIVGVAADEESNRFDPELVRPYVYYPAPLGVTTFAEIRVRTTAKATEFIARFRKLVVETDPTIRIGRSFGMDEFERQSTLATRLVALVVGLVLLSVSLLSAAGVYALTSFTVTRRRREIGIRAALGADAGDVLLAIFSRIAKQIVLGLVIGIGGAAAIDALSGGEMLGGHASVLLPVFAVLMATTATLASVGPARRGLAIDPAEALRSEG